MSWSGSYTHTVLLAVDSFAASIFFNRPDLTISTMCWLVSVNQDAPLKLWGWQRRILVWIGPVLNKIQANHMKLARDGDVSRAQSTLRLLGGNTDDATNSPRTSGDQKQ